MRKNARSGKPGVVVRMRAAIEPLESRLLMSVNVLVHHGDAANDGANLSESVLTPSNVNASDFGKLFYDETRRAGLVPSRYMCRT